MPETHTTQRQEALDAMFKAAYEAELWQKARDALEDEEVHDGCDKRISAVEEEIKELPGK
jgi:hypothetical protein